MKFKFVELEVEGSNATVQEALKALAPAEPTFRHSETDADVSLADMLAANVDDPGLCDWLRSAEIGEVFPGVVSVERVS